MTTLLLSFHHRQSGSDSYTFVAVSHLALSGMASQIGIVVNAITDNTSSFGSTSTFTITPALTQRIFIVRTNHPLINSKEIQTAQFILGTTNFQLGHMRINSVATSPTTSTGNLGLSGDGYRDVTMLSLWGAVIMEQNTTGFAMEFIGDMHDSASAPIFSGSNPVSGPAAP